MKYLIYIIFSFLITFAASYFTDFGKSYWVGFIVAILLDVVWNTAKAVDEA